MRPTTDPANERPRVSSLALTLVAAKLFAHLGTALATPYEFHRDEFLYFSMGTHLRLFGMDFPPMIALLSEALRATIGVSVLSYRLLPGLFGTAALLLAVLIARELGGKGGAQALAAVAVLFNPLFLRTAALFQPVVLDQFWWLLGFWALLRLVNTDEPRWWLVVGLAGGLGLLSKFSIIFFALSVAIGLLLTPRRRDLLGPWPWLALGIALLIGSPSVLGQIRLGFPIVDQMTGLRDLQLARITLGKQLFGQALWGPQIVLALAGLVALLRWKNLLRQRLVGWVCLAALLLFVALRGKPYYSGPVHPALYAAGAVWLQSVPRPRVRVVLVRGLSALVVAWGMFVLPFGLPLVPPGPMARYAAWTGIEAGTTTNWGEVLPLPQDYADMLGWRGQAETVAEVVDSLPADARRNVVLYGANYGQAGALDLYGRRLGLPPVVSLAGSFYFFGPGARPGRIVVLLGVEPEDVETLACEGLFVAARVRNPWGVPEERDVPVTVCEDPAITTQRLWELQEEGGVR